jgi:hypothetical protein
MHGFAGLILSHTQQSFGHRTLPGKRRNDLDHQTEGASRVFGRDVRNPAWRRQFRLLLKNAPTAIAAKLDIIPFRLNFAR